MTDKIGRQEAQFLLASLGDSAKVTRTLAEQIANNLAEDIIAGRYQPGQPLLETALAESFEVSRGPIRDALHILQTEGLVVIQPRRGASVTVLSPEKIREVFEIRAVLYGFVAAEIARARSAKTIAALHQATKALQDMLHADVDAFFALLYRTSVQFVDAGNNDYARKFLSSLARLTLSVTRKVMLDERNRVMWVANWKKVIRAIEKGDDHAAEEAARRWILAVYDKDRSVAETEMQAQRQQEALGPAVTARAA